MIVATTHASSLDATPESAATAGFTYEALAHRVVFGDGTRERVGKPTGSASVGRWC
jgi:hypothetical protein